MPWSEVDCIIQSFLLHTLFANKKSKCKTSWSMFDTGGHACQWAGNVGSRSPCWELFRQLSASDNLISQSKALWLQLSSKLCLLLNNAIAAPHFTAINLDQIPCQTCRGSRGKGCQSTELRWVFTDPRGHELEGHCNCTAGPSPEPSF